MELEKQVCSLNLAKKLKKLGAKQDSFFYWVNWRADSVDDGWKVSMLENGPMSVDFSAFTAAELGEIVRNEKACEVICGVPFFNHELDSRTEADARAELLIFYLENRAKNE